jgi:hypothetical protein
MQLALRRAGVRAHLGIAAEAGIPAATQPAATSVSRPALVLAVVLSLATGWVHLAYTESHFESWWGYGVFFAAVGAGQGLLAAALLRRPTPGVALLGVVGNLGVVLMYVVSRTDGVPLGPHANVAEKATTVDLLTTAGEIVLVVVLLAMLGRTAGRLALNAMMVLGVLLWVGRLTGHLP